MERSPASPPSVHRQGPAGAATQVRRALTNPGWALLLLLVTCTSAALYTGNNRLFLVVGGMLALLVTEMVLGSWNLRNLDAGRRLPAELFAARRVKGQTTLENHRRFLPAIALVLRETGRGDARAGAAWLAPGNSLTLPVTWRFRTRGRVTLTNIEITSRFPFGLLQHRRILTKPVQLLVYPAPKGLPCVDRARTLGSHRCDDDLADPRRAGEGDFLDLREYQAGDPRRLIHWPTSARMGGPMVVIRGSDSDEEVLVEVQGALNPHLWERSISEASGQVLHHVRLGRAVGLQVGRRSWPARRGPTWYRSLLAALALLPHAPDPEGQP